MSKFFISANRGTRVSCIVKDEGAKDGQIICDFTLKEVVEMDTTGMESNLHPVFANALKPFGIQ